jgi:N-acetylated-alpha-linked acidic dipeptidase
MRNNSLRPALVLLISISFITGSASQSADKPLLGFDPAGASAERALEARFDSLLKRDNLRETMKRLSARPHHVGSPYDKENAEFILSLFRSWGFDAQIEEFQVLFPTPKVRVLEMTAPEKFTARLAEPPLNEDSTSAQTSEQLPVYNAYSIDGDVTGQLVYVNYGVPKDYEELEQRGIDVKGKIVITRYGGSWRGIKPKVAAEHGAIGCLIYSDPRDDGFYQGDVYPKGAWRNEYGAQRGSVADMPLYPGDPLTPGVGATKDAKRLALKDARTLTKIPVLPISYADALPLLKAMGGAVAPDAWRGALPLTYHLGPGPATVHLKLAFDWKTETIRDVVARLKGDAHPDELIIRGNHYDAWVNGASDPISGQVAMLEEARALGQLVKTGWKPKRTIVYCAWDGEEPGLLGSTEWAETHADMLRKSAVIYINSDSNGRGFLGIGGSHTLEKFINEVSRDVIDPEKKISVSERARAVQLLQGNASERREARERPDLRIDALGSGSDFTPFLQHLGIASLNLGFGGEDGGGSYHSIYDSFDNYMRFIDPSFDYGIALAEVGGRTVLRFANAEVLPFEFGNLSETLGQYVKEVTQLTNDTREEVQEKNRRLSEGTYTAVFDPAQPFVMPKAEQPAPYLNFAPLENSLARLQESTRKYQTTMTQLASQNKLPAQSAALDQALIAIERAMTREQGLPRRPWFKHQIYAPGFYTGYGVKTLPGVREAIEQHNWQEANEQIGIVSQTFEKVATEIDRATALLSTRQ